MVVAILEEKNNLDDQETINVDNKKFPVKKNNSGDQYMKLLKTHILKKQDYFQQHF